MPEVEPHDIEVELRRVVDRLDSMPLARAAAAAPACKAVADLLVARTRDLTEVIPADAVVPDLGPQGLGSLIAVLGHDYLDAARASSHPDLSPVLDALVELRRSLP